MIKIIKEGIKEFHATCPFCYCEFIYEKEDLHDNMIHCPCCGAIMDAKSHMKEIPAIRDNMVWETPEYKEFQKALDKQVKRPSYVECNKSTNPCETCSYFLKWKTGQIYVGDSPCQWCQYSGLKITCISAGSNEVKFSGEMCDKPNDNNTATGISFKNEVSAAGKVYDEQKESK